MPWMTGRGLWCLRGPGIRPGVGEVPLTIIIIIHIWQLLVGWLEVLCFPTDNCPGLFLYCHMTKMMPAYL